MNIFECFFPRVDGVYACASQHKCFWNPITKLIGETAQQFLQMKGRGKILVASYFFSMVEFSKFLYQNVPAR